MAKKPTLSSPIINQRELEKYLRGIGSTPEAFGDLCARATYLDKSDALIEIEQAITRLRAQRALRLDDTSQKCKPCEVELYYGINLPNIRRTITRQSNRSWDLALQRLNDTALPASQRFLALDYLVAHLDLHVYIERTAETSLLLDAYGNQLTRELFELYFYAYSEYQLDTANTALARRKAAQLLRELDAPSVLGFDDLKVMEWMTDDEQSALERAFDRRYGHGSYADLVMCFE